MLFDKLAQSVLELPGIEGLCLVEAESAALLYNRMPSFIPEFAYETALRRVTTLYETVDGCFLPADDYVLKFRGNSLVLRRAGGVILILFTSDSAHLVSLRIVTNIVLRNMQATLAILEELRSACVPVAVVAMAGSVPEVAAPPVPTVAPKARKTLRVYRGVVIDE